MLRPLEPHDFAAWREVRIRNEDVAAAVGTAAPGRRRRPDPGPCRVRGPLRSAATASEPADHAYPFGVFVDQQVIGEVNINNVTRGALQSATIGYWIDRAPRRQRLHRRKRWRW